MKKIILKSIFGTFIIMISSMLTLYFSTLLHYQLKYGGFSITQLTPAACLAGIASDDKHRILFLFL